MNLRKQMSQVTSFRLVNSLQRSIVLSSKSQTDVETRNQLSQAPSIFSFQWKRSQSRSIFFQFVLIIKGIDN